jgi:2-(1,2-epoxy-1,2-dihydrophenyl)acetyl-CoA isomerase
VSVAAPAASRDPFPAAPQEARDMSEEPSVLFDLAAGGVAVVTLNEGERMNPLTESVQAGLLEALARVRDDRTIRALLLTAPT